MSSITKYTLRYAFRKVPEITAVFWFAKICTTAMGESTSDYLVFHINPYVAVTLGAVGLVIALALQFSTHRYVPWIYWLCVTMVAIFGTMAADVVHIQFHIPYLTSTVLFAAALSIIFFLWHRSEGTLSIHSVTNHHRELFYWATVMATFALGTAAGDMTASTLQLGYFSSGLLFACLIAVPAVAYWLFNLDEVIAFWLAYILTRPLGASFADWVGKSQNIGGLGKGDNTVSAVLTVLIVGAVAYMMLDRRESKRERTFQR